MKEQEPIRGQNELTNQPNSPKLEGEGNIFMAGENGEGQEAPQEKKPETTQASIDAAKAYLDSLGGRKPTYPERQTLAAMGLELDDEGEKKGNEKPSEEKDDVMEREDRAYSSKEIAFKDLEPDLQEAIDRDIDTIPNIGELDDKARDAIRKEMIRGALIKQSHEKNKIGVPESLEDLALLIMKTSDPDVWGKTGEKSLIKEDGTVDSVNFLDWFRNNMLRVHNFNPTSNVNFFNDLGMSVRNDVYGSMISFYEIVFQESLFLDRKEENGKIVTKVNPDYQKLRDQLLQEVFLFQLMRNGDIAYTMNRGQQKEMLGALTEAFNVNPLTRGNFFEFILTMPSMHRSSIRDLEAPESEAIKAKQEGNFFMGDATRQALSAYMNIFDYRQLMTILGEDGKTPALFRHEYEGWNPESGKRETGENAVKKTEKDVGPHNPVDREKEWFYTDEDVEKFGKKGIKVVKGEVKLYKLKNGRKVEVDPLHGLPDPKFMDYINIFLSPNPDQRQQAEIRNRVVLSIMEKNKISFREAQIAEAWAYSMTHIHGISARNDTQSVAFDWWTRITNFQDYRKRQKAEKRGAPYGGNYNMEGFKRIGLNFFEAARDLRGRSIQEIIQGGQGRNISIENNPLKNKVDLERDENGNIVFYDENGQRIQGLSARRYEVFEEAVNGNGKRKAKVRYLDDSGSEVNIGNARAKTIIEKTDAPVQFKADLQKQFLPNHMVSAAGVYQHIIEQVQMNFPEMIKGYDSRGNPILDHEKVDKIKKEIEHDVRYSLSTWPEINYEDTYVMWERKEVRNDNGRLVAKKKGPDGQEQELDEDWYILDKNGHRTQLRDEPVTYLDSRPMTMMESMFGVDALKYIQFEIEKRGLTYSGKSDEKEHKETITGTGFGGEKHSVTVDLTHAKEEEFRIAVWRGAFDYLISSEIASHRDRGSGFAWYNGSDMIKVVDALKAGEFVTPDEIGKIQKETRTKLKWLMLQDLSYIFVTGGLDGFWKIMQLMYKDLLSGK